MKMDLHPPCVIPNSVVIGEQLVFSNFGQTPQLTYKGALIWRLGFGTGAGR